MAVKDDYGNLHVNQKLVSIIYYQYNLLEDFHYDMYEFLELSTAVKIPNVFSYLSSLKPISSTILNVETVKKYFSEEEMVSEISRFLPNSSFNFSSENRNFLAIDYLGYYNSIIKKESKSIENFTSTASNQKDNTIYIEEIVPPTYPSLVLCNKNLVKKNMSIRQGILSFTIALDGKVIQNKNLVTTTRSSDNTKTVFSTLGGDFETLALDVPMLRTDLNLKELNEINYS